MVFIREVLGVPEVTGKAGQGPLPCEVPSVFSTGLLYECGEIPGFRGAHSFLTCQRKPSEKGRAGPLSPRLIVLFLLKQMSQQGGHLLGGDCKEKGESKAFFPEDCPSSVMKRRNASELFPGPDDRTMTEPSPVLIVLKATSKFLSTEVTVSALVTSAIAVL